MVFSLPADGGGEDVGGGRDIAELPLDITDDVVFAGSGEGVATLGENLHEVVGNLLTASQIDTEDGVGESVTFAEGETLSGVIVADLNVTDLVTGEHIADVIITELKGIIEDDEDQLKFKVGRLENPLVRPLVKSNVQDGRADEWFEKADLADLEKDSDVEDSEIDKAVEIIQKKGGDVGLVSLPTKDHKEGRSLTSPAKPTSESAMVFSLPGAGGGEDVRGGGDSRERGEGDREKATDEQMDRVNRLVANKDPDVEKKKICPGKPAHRRRETWVVARRSEGGNQAQRSVAGEKEDKEDLYELNRSKNDVENLEIDDNDYEPTRESNKNAPKKDDEPKGEKEKHSFQESIQKGVDELEEKEDAEDLYELNHEDMEVIHKFPVKKGGPPPYQMCRYELIRERIIADREALMKEVLADIHKESKEIVEENEKSKKRKATDEGKGKKKRMGKVKKVVDIGEARKSERKRKPVNYCQDDLDWEPKGKKNKGERKRKDSSNGGLNDRKPNPFAKKRKIEVDAESCDNDLDWEPKGKKKKVDRKRKDSSNDCLNDRKPLPPGWHHIHNPFAKKRKSEVDAESSDEAPSTSGAAKRRCTRPKQAVNYNIPHADEFVFCDKCGEDKYYGCELHPLIFDYVVHFDVGPSKVGKNAGRGVFNNDPRGVIPEAVMFGPYDGTFYTVEEYEILKQTQGESGYAWELTDPDKSKVIGFVDPGPDPDPLNQWMSIVNCATKTRHQNLMAGQFIGGIYYRSVEVIHYGEELLVYYGNDYARDMKIRVEEMDLYDLEEDWEEEGVSCPHCGDGFVKEEYMQKHIDLADSTINGGGCRVLRREKNKLDVMAGVKTYVCGECGFGFNKIGDLNVHKRTHSDERPFLCSHCDKTYKTKKSLTVHVRSKHEGQTFKCPDCEKPFQVKTSMEQHWKNVCNREDPEFKCNQCGKKFNVKSHLVRHIKIIHNREKPFQCQVSGLTGQVCGKRFSTNQNLQVHVHGFHENERPYKCEDCDKTFSTGTGLDDHRIRRHTHQWYWNCEVCEQGYVKPSELKEHMQLRHPKQYKEKIEKEKPAVCPKCQKRFPSEEQVQIHLKKMHGEENTKH